LKSFPPVATSSHRGRYAQFAGATGKILRVSRDIAAEGSQETVGILTAGFALAQVGRHVWETRIGIFAA
jgi:hypothetical protein